MRAALLSGGPGHPPAASVPSLQRRFDSLDAWEDVDAGLTALDPAVHDVLVVNALACSLPAPRHEAIRDAAAFHLDDLGQRCIQRWHDACQPILVLHTGVISFDTWAGWATICGARWDWERSWHPDLSRSEVTIAGEDIEIVDELYRDLALADDIDVCATGTVDGVAQPVAWTRAPRGRGRVAVDLLGHDLRSLEHPAHVDLLERLVDHLRAPVGNA